MSKDSYNLSHEELARPVLVKKSPRAKRMTLRVSPTKRDVILTIPRTTGLRKAGAFIEQHVDWLNEQLSELPEPVPFENGRIILFKGQLHELVFLRATHQETDRAKSGHEKGQSRSADNGVFANIGGG